jgi:hypothetical protein
VRVANDERPVFLGQLRILIAASGVIPRFVAHRRSSMIGSTLAYLDPGSGSMILQIIAGGVAAVAVTARLYWNRLLRVFRIKRDDSEPGG